jgi:dienelactone hydrolase
MPDGDGPHPAVVLMSGSGPQDRDESLPGMTLRPFALVADALGRAGIAVLRYDDRGTAASTGDYASSAIADFTADGHAAFRWLREQPGIDPAQVGVLGHSEGGAYIAAIAAQDPDMAFVIGLAPMVRSGLDLLIDQTGAIARTQGLDEVSIRELQREMRRLYEAALSNDATELERVLREAMGAQYDLMDPETQALAGDRERYIDLQVTAQLPTLQSPWFQSILRADPSLDWAKVTVPVLGVFGDLDVQVIAAPEAAALEAAFEASGNERGHIMRLADANHLFQSAVTGGLDEYAVLDQTFTPDLLPRLDDWLDGVVDVP